MSESRKRHYPNDRNKLHALCERLEIEIAERQERLAEVRKLADAADNAVIVNAAKTYNVTPEEFVQMVQAFRAGNLFPEVNTENDEPAEAFDLSDEDELEDTDNDNEK